ncbi:probable E3 ubiquitin-protein ligase HECTD2 [Neocloeon triangulifer]|uniref:probable E3 ubiquitin-protein ligase HECTD2 n=1 Tax=Neocloeon triangulifer TaxID=2078957 RepID=UPI00286F769B|nr:probable E3 ubiquitin-protein ligase HECTD2 [Neocloeon triangulifer]XP_059470270.1 probable E3 ubiquitin-protein ligase HECTD2 [Neocloeon triangulifer]XP_059470271.1 probable E3 ubiquitin-protein ligase HECTD2 [Neocloeon triangulifer]
MIHVRLRIFRTVRHPLEQQQDEEEYEDDDGHYDLLTKAFEERRLSRSRVRQKKKGRSRRAKSEGMSSEAILLTCPSCRVTSRVTLTSHSCCPYCGHEYETEGAISFWRNSSEQMLHLPQIEQSRGSQFGNLTISRLGGSVQVTRVGALFLRPPSPTLPPIAQGNDVNGAAWPPHDQNGITPRSYSLHQAPESPESPINYFGKSDDLSSFSREQFLQEVRRAHQTLHYQSIQNFYARIFSSHTELCALISDDGSNSESGIKLELLHAINDALRGMPSTIHKTVLKSIINSLLEDRPSLRSEDEAKALFALLQSPVFSVQRSYTIFAHVLRRAATLPAPERTLLPHYFRLLGPERLRTVIRHIAQFVAIRQFPPSGKVLPPPGKSRWWIPAAARVLALVNAANESCSPPLIHFSELYNMALDHVDLLKEYCLWQSTPNKFSYCQFPFLLSIAAKRYILTKDSEQQMILNARRSLAAKASRRHPPQIDIFFLNIRVRRSNLVSDSLNEIASKQGELKKKLKVSFIGEPGLDMGGLTKEWFLLLVRQIFEPDYGMFVYHRHSHSYWFSTEDTMDMNEDQYAVGNISEEDLAQAPGLREYHLIGVLMGLAVYNSTILDLHLPAVCYRKLLSPPIPPPPGDESVLLGVVQQPTIDDLAEIMPDVAKGISELLAYEGNVEEDMCMSFEVSLEEYGSVRTWPLKPNGDKMHVTNENREEFVALYLDWVLNASIYRQFRAFYLGFHSVCASNALILLRPEEVELLVCGSPTVDLAELRKVTEYDGYRPDDLIISNLWDVLESLGSDMQRKFLLFVTGSDRVPVGGTGEMTFKVTKSSGNVEDLPEAHTCFNQLVLPAYPSKVILIKKLTIAIANAEGFGLE